MRGPLVVLVGVSGAGKTTIGRLVADRLGVGLVETDDLVARETGLSVGQLIISGDPRLPDLQTRGALEALSVGGPGTDGVVTLGASLPAQDKIARAIEVARSSGALVVELVADTAEIARREGLNAPRSVALGAPRAMLTTMIRSLREVYARVADLSVDTVGVAPAVVADRVFTAM